MRAAWCVVFAIITVSVAAPQLSPHDPLTTNPSSQLQPPSAVHPFGTDFLGRDVLSRTLYGGRRTLLIAASATFMAVMAGGMIGVIGGSAAGSLDGVFAALVDAALALPGILLALVVLTALGKGTLPLAIATASGLFAPYARVTQSAVQAERHAPYVEVARSLGAGRVRVFWSHVLPGTMPTLLSFAAVTFAYSVVNAAALSFLGLGGDPSIPDWGVMLWDGRMAFRSAPWISVAPGLAVTLVVLSVNELARQGKNFA